MPEPSHSTTRDPLEQAREALFSLEQINEAYRNRIAQLDAVNSVLMRLAAAENRYDVFADVFSASRSILSFDEALVALPSSNRELRLRAATSEFCIEFSDNNILRKILAGRTLTTTADRLFSESKTAGFADTASILCMPITAEGATGIFAMVRNAKSKPFCSADVESGQHLAVLITQALAQLSKQEAQAQNQAKSAFLATMSHELRTPLNGVIGMTSALHSTPLSIEQSDCLDTIETCGNALLRLIDDILEYSRAECGEMNLQKEAVSPATVVDETAKIVEFQALKKGLQFSVTIHPGAPAAVEGDARRIRQVLLNLIQNAIKFTSVGHIKIDVLPSGLPDRPTARFAISDTGIGVPDNARAFLFQDFYQVDASRTRRFGGTGLGLAISRRIVEQLGGDIGFDSKIGTGSTFWFEIPVGNPGSVQPGALPASAPLSVRQQEPLSVLVAEDSPTNQTVVRLLLEKMGHEVTLTDNGIRAVEQCMASTYDLVLMDMQMPEMDGLEATRQIRALPTPARDTPIIALTANAFDSDVQSCLQAGMDSFLSKPINRQKLQDAIASILQSRERPAPAHKIAV